jgi:hypothetical protein
MGYTHYFTQKRDFSDEEWDEICNIVKKVLDSDLCPIRFECDSEEPPLVDNSQIRFNGIEGDGHETFRITHEMPEEMPFIGTFRCCKTARKGYDLIVCLALLAVHNVAPDAVEISSDGEWDGEWDDSKAIYQTMFSVESTCPWIPPVESEEVFENGDLIDEAIFIPVKGRFGKNRGDARAMISYEGDGSMSVRIDDANNLEFWAEFTIGPDELERPRKKSKQ